VRNLPSFLSKAFAIALAKGRSPCDFSVRSSSATFLNIRRGAAREFVILRKGGFVKKLAALMFFLFLTGSVAVAKDWQTAVIIGTSQTDVTGPMIRGSKTILHYTVETKDFLLLLDYTYHPPTKSDTPDQPGKNSPPNLPLGEPTKIAIAGHHAYLLDVHGAEVKMSIKKKTKV
jgi:hypothetical protein